MAHTFVNDYARAYLTSQPKLGIALGHVIVEGYIDGPTMPMSAGPPRDRRATHRMLIDSDRATELGQGFFIKGFLGLRASLQADRARLAARISDIENECAVRSPLPDHHCIQRGPQQCRRRCGALSSKKGEEAYIDAWIANITHLDSGPGQVSALRSHATCSRPGC